MNKAIGPTISDELHSQSEVAWTNRQTKKRYIHVLLNARHKQIYVNLISVKIVRQFNSPFAHSRFDSNITGIHIKTFFIQVISLRTGKMVPQWKGQKV